MFALLLFSHSMHDGCLQLVYTSGHSIVIVSNSTSVQCFLLTLSVGPCICLIPSEV